MVEILRIKLELIYKEGLKLLEISRIYERFKELGVRDWAYEENRWNPLLVHSKFGEEENYVNYILDDKINLNSMYNRGVNWIL